MPIQEVMWANYYGRLSLGRVRGTAWVLRSAFGGIGLFLAGYVYDLTGSYQVTFAAFAAIPFLAVPLILWARPPRAKA